MIQYEINCESALEGEKCAKNNLHWDFPSFFIAFCFAFVLIKREEKNMLAACILTVCKYQFLCSLPKSLSISLNIHSFMTVTDNKTSANYVKRLF